MSFERRLEMATSYFKHHPADGWTPQMLNGRYSYVDLPFDIKRYEALKAARRPAEHHKPYLFYYWDLSMGETTLDGKVNSFLKRLDMLIASNQEHNASDWTNGGRAQAEQMLRHGKTFILSIEKSRSFLSVPGGWLMGGEKESDGITKRFYIYEKDPNYRHFYVSMLDNCIYENAKPIWSFMHPWQFERYGMYAVWEDFTFRRFVQMNFNARTKKYEVLTHYDPWADRVDEGGTRAIFTDLAEAKADYDRKAEAAKQALSKVSLAAA